MGPFYLKYGVKNSLSESNNLQRQYQILDDYLNNLLRKRILIIQWNEKKKPATTLLELRSTSSGLQNQKKLL